MRRNSRLIVAGLRLVRAAMSRTPSPARRRSAILIRSSSDRYLGEISAVGVLITGA